MVTRGRTEGPVSAPSRKKCLLCNEPRWSKRLLCRPHDDERRARELGPCVDCGLLPQMYSGRCSTCNKRAQRLALLKSKFAVNPETQDTFAITVSHIIERLIILLKQYHDRFETMLTTGVGLGTDPYVMAILEQYWTAEKMGCTLFNFIVRRVNEGLDGIYRLHEQRPRKGFS